MTLKTSRALGASLIVLAGAVAASPAAAQSAPSPFLKAHPKVAFERALRVCETLALREHLYGFRRAWASKLSFVFLRKDKL